VRPILNQNLVPEVDNGELSCKDATRAERPPLTLTLQFATFLQKYPSSRARVLEQNFLASRQTIQEILQRELDLKILAPLTDPFSVPAQKVVHVEASTKMLRILHESKENHLKGFATADESWFHYSYFYPSSKTFAPCLTDVIPRTRQAIGTKQTVRMIFFIGHKRIVLDILPNESKFKQVYFVDYIFPDLKKENVNCHRWVPQVTFWVHMDNRMYHNRSKVESNSRSIMFHDDSTHHIRQTSVPATFGSLKC
jgi:hypothetical protein